MSSSWYKNSIFSLALSVAIATAASADIDLTVNGDFEAGDTSGWVEFPSPNSTFGVTGDAASGSFAGVINNLQVASAAVVKQANIGMGVVTAGETVDISVTAKGSFANGGVAFFEFFSEIDGGGTSSSELLLAPPTFLTDTYQTYNFTVTAGADVSGGITFQAAAITGGATGSTSQVFIDDVSVSIAGIPEPTSAVLLGIGLIGLVSRRRR